MGVKSLAKPEVTERKKNDGRSVSKNPVVIKSLTNQTVIADKCFVAKRFLHRLRGLIGKTHFENGEGMLFPQCNDIHMWFMGIPIDVVFAKRVLAASGEKLEVTSIHRHVKAWKVLPLRDAKATDTLELPVGTIERCQILVGDSLCIN